MLGAQLLTMTLGQVPIMLSIRASVYITPTCVSRPHAQHTRHELLAEHVCGANFRISCGVL
eukprot:11054487-Alexandrium_andersonii.AAC.1